MLTAAPERITYQASGMTFHALTWGPVDGPLALCLHGYPDSAWTWRHLGPHLAELGWRVVAPFTRGYAPTDLAPDSCYQVGALAADAVHAHEALGGDERAVLIGHDWGAITVIPAAAHSPERFAKVVALAVPPLGAMGGRPPSIAKEVALLARQSRRSWYIGFQQLPAISERALARLIPKLWRDWSPGYDASEDLAHVFTALDSPERRTAALRYYRAMARPWTHQDSYSEFQRHWLALPDCPLLYLHGENDGCMLLDYARRAESNLPGNARMEIISGAGHFLQLEQPDAVNSAISAFLN